MITETKPNTLGTLLPNDKFIFEGDKDIYYFIGNFGISGFVCWNETKKQIKTLHPNDYTVYQPPYKKLKILFSV